MLARSTVRTSARAVRSAEGKQHKPVKMGRYHPLIRIKRLWNTQPLSRRLVLMTTGLLAVGLLTVSLAVTSLLSSHLVRQVDDQLVTTAQTMGTQGLNQIREGAESWMPSSYYVEASYIDGKSGRMVSTDTAADYGSPQVPPMSLEQAIAQIKDPRLITVDSDIPGERWRALTLPIQDTTNPRNYLGVVTIALPLSGVTETVQQTRLIVAMADMAVVFLGGVAAAYLVQRAFRSLRQIEAVAGRIASGDLSARVPATEPAITEVGSLQRSLNTMLQINEQAFDMQVVAQERMTRFISDASHELRTPLSAIRGYGELYRMGGVPPERVDEVMGRIESESSRMGRLVDDLLQLARMDEGRKLMMEHVDLTALAASALTDMLVLDSERDCALIPLDPARAEAGEEPEPLVVTGDKDRLSQVLTNLLGNVVRHTPAGSPVEIAVGTVVPPAPPGQVPGPRTAVVEVRDHGPGIPPEDAERVFRRFYRADTSRNRETGGSGLGLSIVSAIMSRHGGTARVLATPGGGATVRLELPLPPE